MVQFRERAATDLVALAEVARRVRATDGYPVYLPGDDYERFLTQPVPIGAWVAEADNGKLAGHVALNLKASPAVISALRAAGVTGSLGVVARLLVDPDCRRTGLGARLLDRACSEALSLNLVPVLDVVVSSTAAIALYRRQGWTEVGATWIEFPDGKRIGELVFHWTGVGLHRP